MKRNMGMIWLLLGGCFLWNPVVGVRDVLPDVLGYILMCVGIARLADLNDCMENAQRYFRRMLWVGFGQIFAWLLVSSFLQKTEESLNRYEEPTWVLLFAFVFLVLEWCFLIPAWKYCFKGLSELAEFHGGSRILEGKKRTRCERFSAYTGVFVVVRSLLTVLPEASVLTPFEMNAEESVFRFDWFSYVTAFRALAILIGLVMGVIWLIGYCRLMYGAITDHAWQDRLRARYEQEILPDIGLLLHRRIGFSFAFFQVGIVFLINLNVLYREMLPDWLSVLLFFCGALMLGQLLERRTHFLISGIALFVISMLRGFLNRSYLKADWIPLDAWHLPLAYQTYLPVRIMSWLEAAFAFLFILCVMNALTQLVNKHIFVHYGEDQVLSKRATERLRAQMRTKRIPVIVSWAIASACKLLECELQPIYGWFWMVQFLCSLVAALLFCSYLNLLAEQLFDRYPLQKRV